MNDKVASNIKEQMKAFNNRETLDDVRFFLYDDADNDDEEEEEKQYTWTNSDLSVLLSKAPKEQGQFYRID